MKAFILHYLMVNSNLLFTTLLIFFDLAFTGTLISETYFKRCQEPTKISQHISINHWLEYPNIQSL
jgi:hypothetical protein